MWPRISVFHSDQEDKLHADAETDLRSFLNSAISATIAGLTMALNGAVERPHALWLSWIYVLPFLVAFFFYRASVGAAKRWGHHVKAERRPAQVQPAEKLGIRPPTNGTEIAAVGSAINRMLLYGEPLPDELLAIPEERP